jgi:hypothetical protein
MAPAVGGTGWGDWDGAWAASHEEAAPTMVTTTRALTRVEIAVTLHAPGG